MHEITINIIVASVTAIVTLGIQNIPKLVASIRANKNHIIIKRKRVVWAMIRYAFIGILGTLLFVSFEVSAVFLMFLSMLLIITNVLIAKDVVSFSVFSVANSMNKRFLVDEKADLLNRIQQENASPQAREKWVKRICEIDEQLNSGAYRLN